ncbi:MAG: CHASE2 domain-containing protein [Betaproteobacteria bacterium]|nr:MAG: CHASE2 domain-containing protein [Betaproteobacteria bacterium]
MTKASFWRKDWFLGLGVSLVLLVASGAQLQLIEGLERFAYDWGVRASARTPSDRISVIAIDKRSIDNIGRWPWSRDIHAKMIESLANAKAKVIGYTVFFSEPQLDPGLGYVSRLLEAYQRLVPANADPSAPPRGVSPELLQIGATLQEAESALNTDRKLAESFAKAGNVVLPLLFTFGEPRGKPDKPLPEFVRKNALSIQGGSGDLPLFTSAVEVPIVESLGAAAAAVGHLNSVPDVDGAIRTEALAITYYDEYYPSLAVMMVARSLNLTAKDIKIRPGEALQIGNFRVSADPTLQMFTYFYKDRDGRPAIQEDSFYDVASGKIPLEKYRDKIVLIGPTAAGVGSIFVTPVNPAMPAVELQAHTVSSLLQGHFFVAPTWGWIVERVVYLLVALYLITLLPRLSAGLGAVVSAGIVALLLTTHFVLMTGQGLWLQFMLPLALLVIGHVLLVTKRFVVTERGKEVSDAQSAANARMLGLAFQGQGQLDMAFDYFRKVPLDDTVMDNLYNLALDFERKRQFNKAEAAFRYMADYDPKFRDLEARLSRAKQMSETLVLGGAQTHPGGTLVLGGGAEKPMLGRYRVEKELGKGAMGVVYLGKDPKIGRVVAIKTMALSQEFEVDELAEVKERFFREAETAGRLSHPNIVTIFDAGEEHDLCYIAMELLKGQDLVPFTKLGDTLPTDKVISIVARVADALGYAHRQNVVHRDVKPANVMYEPENDIVKVTDFGIARITDSSRTKTGMVLGTPSYMSPEQLQGKKIDGRSDLFSLAVSLYQLVCGKLPFEGDSMAQLMYRIANEHAPDILQYCPSLPPALVAFLDKAMSKDAGERYQTGEEFAGTLRGTVGGPSATAIGAGVDISL